MPFQQTCLSIYILSLIIVRNLRVLWLLFSLSAHLFTGIIVLILYFVLSQEGLEADTFVATSVLHAVIQALSAAGSLLGLIQISPLSVRHSCSAPLAGLLHRVGVLATLSYAAFACAAAAAGADIHDVSHALLLIDGGAMLLHAVTQSLFVQVGYCY